MKKIVSILIVILCVLPFDVYAQSPKNVIKERKEIAKASNSELNGKVSKAASKEAKQLKKDG